MQKLADNAEKAAKELGKSEEQLTRNNAQELLNQFKSKATNEAEIKAVEELVTKINTQANKLEVSKLSESINSAHEQIAEAVKNFGKTSEQIEISNQQIALETMARKGATESEIAAAKAKIEDTQRLYDHQMALESEKKNREESINYLNDMKTRAGELAAELSGGKEGLIAFQLAAKNASAETIRQAQATNKVVEQLHAQMQVNQTLVSLSDQVAKLGMNEIQKQLYDLKKQGATPEQLKLAKAYLDQIERDKQLQEHTKKAAEKLNTAGSSLTDAAKALTGISAAEQKAQAKIREEAERKRKQQEELESSGLSLITGKKEIDDLTVDTLNVTTPFSNFGFNSFTTAGKFDDLSNSKTSSGTIETLKIDFSYNGKHLIGEIFANPVFKKQFMQFFERFMADFAKNIS